MDGDNHSIKADSYFIDNEARLKTANFYFEEYKYRHTLFWHIFYRFAFAILFVLSVPFIHPDKIENVKSYIYLFPLSGILLSVLGGWLLGAEYIRLKMVIKRYDKLLPNCTKHIPFTKSYEKIFKPSIGWVMTISFFVVFSVLSIFTFLTLKDIGGG